ncbi:hypothetical protein [Adhaeribacter terrigena]|nr:hypothetical protein [Adhaeribacter terrigena]
MFRNRDNVFMLALLVLQAVIIFYTFRDVLSTSDEFLLVNSWDGLKNYFTYYAWLKQPETAPFFHFTQHNYPFGETVLYTDNTPLFAALVKVFSRWVFDLTPYALSLHNAFMVAGLAVASLILYRIFRLLRTPQGIAFAAAFFLPWISPQLLRLKLGHYNLSFSWVLLLVVYLLLKLYQHFPDRRKTLQLSGALVVTLVLSSFLHMYYLLLNLSFIGFFFLFWFLRCLLKKREINVWVGVLGLINVCIPPALVLAIIRLPDENYHLRRSIAEGYDRLDWKLNLEAFITPYPYNKLKLEFLRYPEIPYESWLYLGGFVLGSFIVWLIMMVLLRIGLVKINRLSEKEPELIKPFLWLFGLSALGCTFIAMGETYAFFGGAFTFTNYFNLFFYIHQFSEVVTQFRVLSRFAWIVFWFCNIAAVYWLGFVWKHYTQPVWLKLLVVPGLLLLLAIDMRDMRKHISKVKGENVMSHPKHLQFMRNLAGNLDPQEFQAILPIPFYHEGSEDYDISLFPDDAFYRGSIQLSEVTGLPIMASKLSRTPPVQVQHFLSIFLALKPDTALTNRLNAKPVLVLYNRAYYNGQNNFYQDLKREPALSAYKKGKNLSAEKGWEMLAQQGDYVLYKAYLK